MSYVDPPPAYSLSDLCLDFDRTSKAGNVIKELFNEKKLTVIEIVSAVQQLSPLDREALASAGKGTPVISPQQRRKLNQGLARESNSQENQATILAEAQKLATASVAVQNGFNKISLELAKVDALNLGSVKFLDRWNSLSAQYRTLLGDSREHAMKIATYADSFGKVQLPVVLSSSVTIERKKTMMADFIAKAEEHKNTSAAIEGRFDALSASLLAFRGEFETFATAQEGELNASLVTLRSELLELHEKVRDMKIALYAVAGAAVVGTVGLSIGSFFAGPFSGPVLVAAFIYAAISAATIFSLLGTIPVVEDQVKAKQAQIDAATASIALIQSTRVTLTGLSQTDITLMTNSIGELKSVWTSVKADAVAILGYLDLGMPLTDIPEALQTYMDESKTAYTAIAASLKAYAKGILDSGVLPAST